MKRDDLMWLAGLLEGEGSFGISYWPSKSDPQYVYPRVRLQMTDEDVVERAAFLLRTRCSPVKLNRVRLGRLPQFMCESKSVGLLRALRPEMGTRRRARIDEILGTLEEAMREEKE